MKTRTSVAIIGAGPYGLSLAAHLAAVGITPRVFGTPMRTWRHGMPHGMLLKSEGFASSLSDPAGTYTLGHYCRDNGLPYRDIGWPVPVEVFAAYGEAFARRFVPQVDPREVARVERSRDGFLLLLADGESLVAEQVIVATGISGFGRVPGELAALPASVLTHSSRHADYSHLARSSVAVIGAGASALDAAAALRRAGADVSLVTRRSAVRFYTAGRARGWTDALRSPMTPLGPGWKKLLCCKAPLLFHALPESVRTGVVRRYLGPAPGWFVRETIEGHVPYWLNATIHEARMEASGRVALAIDRPVEGRKTLVVDHVVAATGYRVEVDRIGFLDDRIKAEIATVDASPILSRAFESSVPSLYFVGTPSAYSFGPMLRFVCGADYAARRVTHRVLRTARATPSASGSRVPWATASSPARG